MRLVSCDESMEYFFIEGCHILEWYNSEADQALSYVRARVEPGKTTRWHKLANTVERYTILSGEGRVEVGDEVRLVTPNDSVYIPASTRQRITNTGQQDLVFIAACTPRFQPKNYTHCD